MGRHPPASLRHDADHRENFSSMSPGTRRASRTGADPGERSGSCRTWPVFMISACDRWVRRALRVRISASWRRGRRCCHRGNTHAWVQSMSPARAGSTSILRAAWSGIRTVRVGSCIDPRAAIPCKARGRNPLGRTILAMKVAVKVTAATVLAPDKSPAPAPGDDGDQRRLAVASSRRWQNDLASLRFMAHRPIWDWRCKRGIRCKFVRGMRSPMTALSLRQ